MTSPNNLSQDTILIIDEDENVLVPLSHYFDEQGLNVITATTGRLGMSLATKHRPSLILLSPSLRDMDGLEIFRTLRRAPLTSHVPIMLLANRRDAQRQNQLLAEGPDDVIVKPFDVELLALRVRNAIQRARREGLTEPRTGLPTGPLIAEKVAAIEARQDWYRLDVTIEHFDDFRNRYNFIAGNEALRFAASEICEIVDELGTAEDFVGHSEDTHFVVLTDAERGPAVREALAARVEEGLHQFYDFVEREQGYIIVEDRYGETGQRPLMRLKIEVESGSRGQRDHAAS